MLSHVPFEADLWQEVEVEHVRLDFVVLHTIDCLLDIKRLALRHLSLTHLVFFQARMHKLLCSLRVLVWTLLPISLLRIPAKISYLGEKWLALRIRIVLRTLSLECLFLR